MKPPRLPTALFANAVTATDRIGVSHDLSVAEIYIALRMHWSVSMCAFAIASGAQIRVVEILRIGVVGSVFRLERNTQEALGSPILIWSFPFLEQEQRYRIKASGAMTVILAGAIPTVTLTGATQTTGTAMAHG